MPLSRTLLSRGGYFFSPHKLHHQVKSGKERSVTMYQILPLIRNSPLSTEKTVSGYLSPLVLRNSVASQVAAAFSREMGLTSPMGPDIDCGSATAECKKLPTGGTVEVEAPLFMALLTFQELHAVARTLELQLPEEEASRRALRFEAVGCSACHRMTTAPEGGAR